MNRVNSEAEDRVMLMTAVVSFDRKLLPKSSSLQIVFRRGVLTTSRKGSAQQWTGGRIEIIVQEKTTTRTSSADSASRPTVKP